MGVRTMPYFEAEGKPQFAGMGSGGSGGGGGGGGSTSYNYSTTPYDTGKKWIDGRTVKGVVFEGTVTSSAQTIDVTSLNMDRIFIQACYVDIPSAESFTGQYYWSGSDYFKIDLRTNKTILNFNIPSKYISNDNTYTIIAEYVENQS